MGKRKSNKIILYISLVVVGICFMFSLFGLFIGLQERAEKQESQKCPCIHECKPQKGE